MSDSEVQIIKKNFWDELKDEWGNTPFKILIISSILLIISSFLSRFFSQVKILLYLSAFFLFLWITCFCFYLFKNKSEKWKKQDKFQKIYLIYVLIIMSSFLFLLIILVIKKFQLVVLVVFLFSIVLLIFSAILLKSTRKSPTFITISYAFVAFTTILFFTLLFILATLSKDNLIIDLQNKMNVTEAVDFMYFSSATFYAITYGDFVPKGNWMHLISQIEGLVSTIIHIIILGWIISRPQKQDNLDNDPKK